MLVRPHFSEWGLLLVRGDVCQVIYRLGTTLPGWLTSASTRRDGIVTLTDLTRTLIEFGSPGSSVAVDGSPFAVYNSELTVDEIDAKIISYKRIASQINDEILKEALAGLLEKMQAEKSSLHPELCRE